MSPFELKYIIPDNLMEKLVYSSFIREVHNVDMESNITRG